MSLLEIPSPFFELIVFGRGFKRRGTDFFFPIFLLPKESRSKSSAAAALTLKLAPEEFILAFLTDLEAEVGLVLSPIPDCCVADLFMLYRYP